MRLLSLSTIGRAVSATTIAPKNASMTACAFTRSAQTATTPATTTAAASDTAAASAINRRGGGEASIGLGIRGEDRFGYGNV